MHSRAGDPGAIVGPHLRRAFENEQVEVEIRAEFGQRNATIIKQATLGKLPFAHEHLPARGEGGAERRASGKGFISQPCFVGFGPPAPPITHYGAILPPISASHRVR